MHDILRERQASKWFDSYRMSSLYVLRDQLSQSFSYQILLHSAESAGQLLGMGLLLVHKQYRQQEGDEKGKKERVPGEL